MRRTVLLVEDEAKIADVLAEQLGEEGFDVRQARSLRQALRMLDDLVPDVAIIDIGLPDGSGLDVLRRLRCGADRLDSGTPVLVLTARTEEADVLRGFERGADDYLRKPFALPELIARVHALLVARAPRPRRHPRRRAAARAIRPARELGGHRAAALGARVRPAARARSRSGGGALEGRSPARGLAHAGDAAHAHRRLAREPPAAQARRGRCADRIRS